MQGEGAATYAVSSWIFLRLMALVYGAAFISLGVQIRGLVGSRGILPAAEVMESARRRPGASRYLRHPTIFWLGASDGALVGACVAGAALAVALGVGLAPVAVLAALWALYLSLITVCDVFLGFQWDVLLVEAGFLAIWMAPLTLFPRWPAGEGPPALARGLVLWLLARLMFSSGASKLLSGDPAWRRLTALRFHYETQPLPTPLAWYAHQLPLHFHRACAAIMFAVELGAPFFLLIPGAPRAAAVASIAAFMLLIMLTGNYGFFNPITIALGVPLLPDSVWSPLLCRIPGWEIATGAATSLSGASVPGPGGASLFWPLWAVLPVAALVLLLSVSPGVGLVRWDMGLPARWTRSLSRLRRLRLVNGYGLFAVMTTTRREVVIEVSHDGRQWSPCEPRWKPGNVRMRPRFAGMHMPRLDWQLWFAALGDPRFEPWLASLLSRLRDGSPEVRRLFRSVPSLDGPALVRARLERYRFTTPSERRATGAWWHREESDVGGASTDAGGALD